MVYKMYAVQLCCFLSLLFCFVSSQDVYDGAPKDLTSPSLGSNINSENSLNTELQGIHAKNATRFPVRLGGPIVLQPSQKPSKTSSMLMRPALRPPIPIQASPNMMLSSTEETPIPLLSMEGSETVTEEFSTQSPTALDSSSDLPSATPTLPPPEPITTPILTSSEEAPTPTLVDVPSPAGPSSDPITSSLSEPSMISSSLTPTPLTSDIIPSPTPTLTTSTPPPIASQALNQESPSQSPPPTEPDTSSPEPTSTPQTLSPIAQLGISFGATFAAIVIAACIAAYIWHRRRLRQHRHHHHYPPITPCDTKAPNTPSSPDSPPSPESRISAFKSFFTRAPRHPHRDDAEWSIESASQVAIVKNMRARSISTGSSSGPPSGPTFAPPVNTPTFNPATFSPTVDSKEEFPTPAAVGSKTDVMTVAMRDDFPALTSHPLTPRWLGSLMSPRVVGREGEREGWEMGSVSSEKKEGKEREGSWPLGA